jgi:hypothetical protein
MWIGGEMQRILMHVTKQIQTLRTNLQTKQVSSFVVLIVFITLKWLPYVTLGLTLRNSAYCPQRLLAFFL